MKYISVNAFLFLFFLRLFEKTAGGKVFFLLLPFSLRILMIILLYSKFRQLSSSSRGIEKAPRRGGGLREGKSSNTLGAV